MLPAWPCCPASDRSDLIRAADRPYLDTISLSAVGFHLAAETPAIRCLLQGELFPTTFPAAPSIHLWLLSGASRVRSRRFPCPRRSCPRRATKTAQTLNWVEEHKGDRTSEHSWPPGTWSSAPHRCSDAICFPWCPATSQYVNAFSGQLPTSNTLPSHGLKSASFRSRLKVRLFLKALLTPWPC